ncbi:MAG TPA: hypothetical protein VFI95_18150 [Terriglobales bacterium]|nr:hypothetical protein [Terriglobales bacterium]
MLHCVQHDNHAADVRLHKTRADSASVISQILRPKNGREPGPRGRLAFDGRDFNWHTGGFLRRHSGAVGDPSQQPRTQQNQQHDSGDSDAGHSDEEEECFEKNFSATLTAPRMIRKSAIPIGIV